MSEILINITRGNIIENIVRGDIVVINNQGELIAASGNPYKLSYMRSAAKPIQAAAIVERGVVNTFNLNSKELAVMCSSHIAGDYHIEVINSILDKIGLTEDDFQLGPDYSLNPQMREELIAKGIEKRKIFNNCSGKHASMLALCVKEGWDKKTYYLPGHPVQNIILDNMAYYTGVPKEDIIIGIDGCGVPVFGVPLFNMAWAYNRLVNHQNLAPEKTQVADMIISAMWDNPEMVSGRGEFTTALLEACKGHILGKIGADGVYCCTVKDGPSIAVKIEDGNGSVLPYVMVSILTQLEVLDKKEAKALQGFSTKNNINCREEIVGEIKPSFELSKIKLGKMEY